MSRFVLAMSVVCLWLPHASEAAAKWVNESARNIPVVYDVDVVVVGGAAAGVAAAVEAAENGAKVFVAAPRPYLGESVCATYRLWLEPSEKPTSPLAKELFADPRSKMGLPFTYEADMPSEGVHKDTDPPSMLADGMWDNAFKQSVQYNGDTTVTMDLGETRGFREIRVMVFQSLNSYEIESVTITVSNDKREWRQAGVIRNERLGKESYAHSALRLAAPVREEARYIRCLFKKGPRAQRILIGEIHVVPMERPAVSADRRLIVTPMQVKRALDKALLDAGVSFLFGCYATDVLRDAEGNPAGIVMANRAGRQAVTAKVIIDATDRAWVARMAGGRFRPYPAGPQTFKRIVVGGPIRTGEGIEARAISLRTPIGGKPPISYGTGGGAAKKNLPMSRKLDEIIEYTLTIPMKDGSFASFAEAEQVARDLTFHPEQVDESEVLLQVPPDRVTGRKRLSGDWSGAESADLDWFRPRNVNRLYVLGACADISRPAAEKLLRPLELMAVGRRIGAAAAADAKGMPRPVGVRLRGRPAAGVVSGDTRESLTGLRATQSNLPTIRADGRSVPVLGEYDVVVIGGGTSGAPAGIGAARQGAKTLVIEYLHGLGGVGTTGLIGIYCAGYRKGFTAHTEAGIEKIGAPSYVIGKMEWWRREIRSAGGDIWFGALGVGAFVEKGKVKGAVVVTPQGRGVVLAKVVIDATGHSDIAAAAGAECMYTDGAHIGRQGAGLPQREPGATYINTDWTFIDDSDMIDVWSAFVLAKKRYASAYDLGQLIDTRDRRRIVGDHILSPLDIINKRTFPDTVGISSGGRLDKHGFTVHPYYMINNWRGGISYTPYRCLLPRGLDGILVTGLGISAHCDAIPSVRMQPCMQNLGYATGTAAAMAAKRNGVTRDVDIRALQRHLVSTDCLTRDVPSHTDSYPLPETKIKAAVRTLAEKDYSGLGIILAQRDVSVPLMRAAYDSPATTPEGRLRCAHVLGIIGDATGVETLIGKVGEYAELDEGNIDRYFPCITWLDSYIIALGRTRDRRALKPILDKLALLGVGKGRGYSHYRAVAMALEALRAPEAAQPLAALLEKTSSTSGAMTDISQASARRRTRTGIQRLILARVLYRCGDYKGLGKKVLKEYERDLRGHYARHSHAVLTERKPDP